MNKEISIGDLIKKVSQSISYLKSQWPIIAFVSLLCGGLFFLQVWRSDAKYTARLTFVSENESGGTLGGYAGIAAQFGLDIGAGGGSAFEGDNLIELLKSQNLIEQVLLSQSAGNKLMIDDYLILHHLKFKHPVPQFQPNMATQGLLGDSILQIVYNRIVKKGLDIQKIDKKIDFVYIQYTDNDQAFAKKFVEQLAQKAIVYYTDYKTKKHINNIKILQKQVDSVRGMLFGNISDIASVNDLNINPLKQILRTNTQKKQIDLQVNSVLYGELLKNLELSKLTLRKESPLIQIIDTPKLPLKNEKLGRLAAAIIGIIIGMLLTCVYLLIRKGLFVHN